MIVADLVGSGADELAAMVRARSGDDLRAAGAGWASAADLLDERAETLAAARPAVVDGWDSPAGRTHAETARMLVAQLRSTADLARYNHAQLMVAADATDTAIRELDGASRVAGRTRRDAAIRLVADRLNEVYATVTACLAMPQLPARAEVPGSGAVGALARVGVRRADAPAMTDRHPGPGDPDASRGCGALGGLSGLDVFSALAGRPAAGGHLDATGGLPPEAISGPGPDASTVDPGDDHDRMNHPGPALDDVTDTGSDAAGSRETGWPDVVAWTPALAPALALAPVGASAPAYRPGGPTAPTRHRAATPRPVAAPPPAATPRPPATPPPVVAPVVPARAPGAKPGAKPGPPAIAPGDHPRTADNAYVDAGGHLVRIRWDATTSAGP
jgi:hypothetical protein